MNIGKRVLIALFGLTIVFLLVASASACTDDQVIMKLNKITDSHGATYDSSDSDYNLQICFDSFTVSGAQFQPASGAPNAHSCSGVNPLVYLTASSNAHASNESVAEYQTFVCYQGLTNCEIVKGSCSDKTPIVYLSNYTNAHLSRSGGAGTDYPYTACCNVAGGGTVTPPAVTFTSCSNYTDALACSDDNQGIADTDLGCPTGSSCSCEWNANTGKCNVAVSLNTRCNCIKESSETACVNSVKTVTLKAHVEPKAGFSLSDCTNAAGCTDETNPNVPCGQIGELPFFGGLQFVITLTAILMIYSAFAVLKKYS